MLMYCKKCGRVVQDANICDICGTNTYKVPKKYWLDGLDFLISDDSKKILIEECIKSSPEFDEELFNSRDEILVRKNAEYEQKMAIGDAIRNGADVKTAFRNGGQNMPKCPTCGSLKVEKISTGKKVFGVAMFGLFSSDVRNTMHCKNCGYKW